MTTARTKRGRREAAEFYNATENALLREACFLSSAHDFFRAERARLETMLSPCWRTYWKAYIINRDGTDHLEELLADAPADRRVLEAALAEREARKRVIIGEMASPLVDDVPGHVARIERVTAFAKAALTSLGEVNADLVALREGDEAGYVASRRLLRRAAAIAARKAAANE